MLSSGVVYIRNVTKTLAGFQLPSPPHGPQSWYRCASFQQRSKSKLELHPGLYLYQGVPSFMGQGLDFNFRSMPQGSSGFRSGKATLDQ